MRTSDSVAASRSGVASPRTIPRVGLGTWQLENEACERAVRTALELGYRHVDTAQGYGNEEAVGRGLRASGVPREDVWVTTKLGLDALARDRVGAACEASLARLGCEWLDSVLVHWPSAEVPLAETLDALEAQRRGGRLRHIGVSNFPAALLEEAAGHCRILCDQVEYHPFLAQRALRRTAARLGVALVAYSPLARGRAPAHPVVREAAAAVGCSPGQAVLAWLLGQPDVAVIPKAGRREHLEENLGALSVRLPPEQADRISALACGDRIFDPPFAPRWDDS